MLSVVLLNVVAPIHHPSLLLKRVNYGQESFIE
jgi:hypothetical protein